MWNRLPISKRGGTCWAESIENIIQLMKGDREGKLNDLSDRIIEKVASEPEKWDAIKHPEASEFRDRWNIPTYKYEAMLGEFGVDAKTMRFSHAELQSALKENRPVILVGDVKALKEQYGGQSGGHALVAIDWEPDAGKYVLLDSNSKEVYRVTPKRLESFVKGTFSDKINNFLCGNMTVTQTPARWPSWKVFVDGKWKMYVDGREIKNPLDDFAEFTRKDKNETVAFRGDISEIELTKMKYADEKLGREIEEAHKAGKRDLEYKLKQERDSLKSDIAKYIASNGYNGDAYRSATRINYR